jgi:hypothetical protein
MIYFVLSYETMKYIVEGLILSGILVSLVMNSMHGFFHNTFVSWLVSLKSVGW